MRYRLPKYISLLEGRYANAGPLDILEIGAGVGEISRMLRSGPVRIKRYVATEYSYPAVVHLKNEGLQCAQVSAEELPFADNSFDLVFCVDVMHHVAFSPDGRLLATSEGFGEKGSAHLFELASGKAIAQMLHPRQVNNATFSPDGLTLATASDDHIARLWRVFPTTQALVDAAKARAARCLTQAQRKQYFLSPAPPLWCVERQLWPYHSDDWQAWLAAKKAGKDAPLPAN